MNLVQSPSDPGRHARTQRGTRSSSCLRRLAEIRRHVRPMFPSSHSYFPYMAWLRCAGSASATRMESAGVGLVEHHADRWDEPPLLRQRWKEAPGAKPLCRISKCCWTPTIDPGYRWDPARPQSQSLTPNPDQPRHRFRLCHRTDRAAAGQSNARGHLKAKDVDCARPVDLAWGIRRDHANWRSVVPEGESVSARVVSESLREFYEGWKNRACYDGCSVTVGTEHLDLVSPQSHDRDAYIHVVRSDETGLASSDERGLGWAASNRISGSVFAGILCCRNRSWGSNGMWVPKDDIGTPRSFVLRIRGPPTARA